MSESYEFVHELGHKVIALRYTRGELRQAWEDLDGQGNRESRDHRPETFVAYVPDETSALQLTALMVRHVFAVPSCATYDYQTKRFAFFCGDAGTSWRRCLGAAEATYERWLLGEPDDDGRRGPLFQEVGS